MTCKDIYLSLIDQTLNSIVSNLLVSNDAFFIKCDNVLSDYDKNEIRIKSIEYLNNYNRILINNYMINIGLEKGLSLRNEHEFVDWKFFNINDITDEYIKNRILNEKKCIQRMTRNDKKGQSNYCGCAISGFNAYCSRHIPKKENRKEPFMYNL